jgi:hypothetical protein
MRELKIIRFTIVMLLIIIMGLYAMEKYSNITIVKNNNHLELELNKVNNELRIFKDSSGFYRASAESAESNIKTITDVYRDELAALRKEFNRINGNYTNLRGFYTTTLQTNGNLKIKLDSLLTTKLEYDIFGNIENIKYIREFTYSDNWSKFHGEITTNSINSNLDNILFNYNVRDSLTFVSYYRQKNFIGKRTLYIEGKSYNPNTTIMGIKEVNINNTYTPKWNLGLQFGYGITTRGMAWYAGIGVNKTLYSW